ncbi:MAG TPA: hypothetical protein ENF97_00045 [Candidatus Omnitrophica bacterium]|nr:hypothetical protein [Candidatus Omnitrophota bacterium]
MGGYSVKGITLIELIISIVVFALIMTPLLLVFATVSQDTAGGIYISRAHTLAQSYMELILSRSFDENNKSPWTARNDLGLDSGETAGDLSTYDDVDDFDGYTITDSDYPAITGTVSVYYVEDGDWDTPYTGASYTNYKRIDIVVTLPQGLGSIKVSNGVTGTGHDIK